MLKRNKCGSLAEPRQAQNPELSDTVKAKKGLQGENRNIV